MLFQCWASVEDGGPTLKQLKWVNVPCLLGLLSQTLAQLLQQWPMYGTSHCKCYILSINLYGVSCVSLVLWAYSQQTLKSLPDVGRLSTGNRVRRQTSIEPQP